MDRKFWNFVSHINSQSELITEKFDSASRSVVYIEAARVDKALIHHVEIKSKERLKADLQRSSPSIYLTKPTCLTVGPFLQKLAVPMTSFAGYHCYEYSLPTEDTSPVPSTEGDDELPFVDIHPPGLDSVPMIMNALSSKRVHPRLLKERKWKRSNPMKKKSSTYSTVVLPSAFEV